MEDLLFLTDIMRTTRLRPHHTRRCKGQVCSPEVCLSPLCARTRVCSFCLTYLTFAFTILTRNITSAFYDW